MCVTWTANHAKWFPQIFAGPKRATYDVCLIRLVSSAIWL
jgi:hypothetical protein